MIDCAEYRESVAVGGRQYAISLGGEDRLSRDLQAAVLEDWT